MLLRAATPLLRHTLPLRYAIDLRRHFRYADTRCAMIRHITPCRYDAA